MTIAQRTAGILQSLIRTRGIPPHEAALDSAERRQQRRIETLQPATIHVTSTSQTLPALIRDFSSGGLGVVVNGRIKPGEIIIVEWHHGFLIGTVRHLRPAHDGWIAGVQLESTAAHEAVLTELAVSESKARMQQLYGGAKQPGAVRHPAPV